jgi:hypothetical protein
MSASRDFDRNMKIIRFTFTPLLVLLYCRLYWFRGVTVPLPGWVIWKYWNCPCKFFCNWIVSALSSPNGGEGYNSYTDLNPNTTKYVHIKSTTVYAPRRNWDSPQPPTRRLVCPLPPVSGGRGTLAGKKGVGRVPIPTRGIH